MENNKKKGTPLEELIGKLLITIVVAGVVLLCICALLSFIVEKTRGKETGANAGGIVKQPEIEEMFLTPNQYSRPQKELKNVNGIVIHYTANPGSSAEANRNYFENLKNKKNKYASSHFVVGLDGEIVQCIPLDEIAYASNNRNDDTISIECCHEDEDGKFNEETYESLVHLVAWLCDEYGLEKEDIIRHYDVTGKLCPKYFVEHKKAWNKFKSDVFDYIESQRVKLEPAGE